MRECRSLLLLLALPGFADVLSSLVNNLPAPLILLPAVHALPVSAVLPGLIGANLGPTLASFGSLATLLWRRVLLKRGCQLSADTPYHVGGSLGRHPRVIA